MTKALFLLYGDRDFDGRVQRMQDIVSAQAEVHTLDATTTPLDETHDHGTHQRVQLRDNWGVARRHLAFWKAAMLKAWRLKPDIIVAANFFACFPGWLTAQVSGARLVYDAYELIIPAPGQKLSLRSWVWYRLERFVVPRCDYVIAANPERAALMREHYGLRERPDFMRNIPTFRPLPDSDRLAALARYPALQHRAPDDRILLYQGDISLERGLGRFIEAVRHLPQNWRLVVIGDGPDLDRLKAMAALLERAGRFDAIGRVPSRDLPALTVHGDIGIVTYPFQGLNNIYCAPNKVYEYMMAGLPVIASSQPTIVAILEELGHGIAYAETDDSASLADKIIALNERGRPDPNLISTAVMEDKQSAGAKISAKLLWLIYGKRRTRDHDEKTTVIDNISRRGRH